MSLEEEINYLKELKNKQFFSSTELAQPLKLKIYSYELYLDEDCYLNMDDYDDSSIIEVWLSGKREDAEWVAWADDPELIEYITNIASRHDPGDMFGVRVRRIKHLLWKPACDY